MNANVMSESAQDETRQIPISSVLFGSLTESIRQRFREVEIIMEPYDPDFIVAVVMDWCAANDAVVTQDGPRRLKNRVRL